MDRHVHKLSRHYQAANDPSGRHGNRPNVEVIFIEESPCQHEGGEGCKCKEKGMTWTTLTRTGGVRPFTKERARM